MKALVLENRAGSSTILLENGSVVKVDGEHEVGRTLILKEKKSGTCRKGRAVYSFAKRAIAAAAAAILFIAGIAGGFCFQTAYACSYVSLDVNPSIEFSLNRMDRVLSVKPMNDDAEPIVERLMQDGVKGKTLAVAISRTREAVKEMDGDGDDKTYLVDISSDSEKRTRRLTREIETAFRDKEDEDKDEPRTRLVLVSSSVNDRNAAQSLGISTGRYTAMKQASKEDDGGEISEEMVGEYKSKAVKEIVKDSEVKALARQTREDAAKDAPVKEEKPAPPEAPPMPEPEPPAEEVRPEEQPEPAPQPAPDNRKSDSKKKKKDDNKDEENKEDGKETPAAETGDASEADTGDAGAGSTVAAGEDEGFASDDSSQAGSTDGAEDPAAASTGDTAGEAGSGEQGVTDGSQGGTGATDTAGDPGTGSGAEAGEQDEQTNDASAGSGATEDAGTQEQAASQTSDASAAAPETASTGGSTF